MTIQDVKEFKYHQKVRIIEKDLSMTGKTGTVQEVAYRDNSNPDDLTKRYRVSFGTYPSYDERWFFADDLE